MKIQPPKIQRMVGHNIFGFDLPYLIRWSIFNGIQIPTYCTPLAKGGRYFPDMYIDTMQVAGAGEFGHRISLDNLSKACGGDGKNGDGKFFYQLSPDEKEEYLHNDLVQTKSVFDKMNHSFGFTRQFTIFDIETCPKSDEEIERIAPAFDPDSVKLGNIKDAEKIQAKIEQAQESHLESIIDKAGLRAQYSNPIAIGYLDSDGNEKLHFDEPKVLVEYFWKFASAVQQNMRD